MFKNHTVFIHTVLSLFLTQCTFWLVYLTLPKMPPVIPLLNFQQGAARLVTLNYIWILPGIAIGLLAVDLLFVALTYRKQPFLVGTMMGFTSIINLLIFLITLRLIGVMIGWI